MKLNKKIIIVSFVFIALITIAKTEIKELHQKSIDKEQIASDEPVMDTSDIQTQSLIDFVIKLFTA